MRTIELTMRAQNRRDRIDVLGRRRTDPGEHISAAARSRHRRIPTLLWPTAAVGFTTSGVGFDQLRAVLSVAVAVTGTDTPLPHACTLLGSIATPEGVARVLRLLRARSDWAHLASSITALAARLDAKSGAIDYQRRRELSYEGLLTDSQWRRLCQETSTVEGSGPKIRLYRCWLFERLTGIPGYRAPHAVPLPRFRAALAGLSRALTPEVVVALDAVAREFLAIHDCTDEPVRWRPMLDEPTSAAPPAMTWGTTAVERLHNLLRDEGLSLRAAAHLCDVNIGVVREVLNDHPVPPGGSTTPHRGAGVAITRARQALSEQRFRRLYEGERRSLASIAAAIGVSRSTVAVLSREYRIALRPAHRPSYLR
ncbi:hypothetical protein ACXPWS_29270 [Mycobacterium sp. BMJ-28]